MDACKHLKCFNILPLIQTFEVFQHYTLHANTWSVSTLYRHTNTWSTRHANTKCFIVIPVMQTLEVFINIIPSWKHLKFFNIIPVMRGQKKFLTLLACPWTRCWALCLWACPCPRCWPNSRCSAARPIAVKTRHHFSRSSVWNKKGWCLTCAELSDYLFVAVVFFPR